MTRLIENLILRALRLPLVEARISDIVAATIERRGVNWGAVTGLEAMVLSKVEDAVKDVSTDDVSGLEQFVDDAVSSAIEDVRVPADNVEDLDAAIETAVGNVDFEDAAGFDGAVRGIVEEMSDHIEKIAIDAIKRRLA